MSTLDELLGSLPGYSVLTDVMKETALAGALIPDAQGVWPGAEGYTPTPDYFFAAANLLTFLQAQPLLTSTSSEGTSVTVTAPNWNAIRQYYLSQSPIIRAAGYGVMTRMEIPDMSHTLPVSMDGRRDSYGDIDTDMG